MEFPKILSVLAVGLVIAGCGGSPDGAASEPANGGTGDVANREDCQPLETREANAPAQQPAFPEQTRACAVESNVSFSVEVVATGLEHPWAVAPLPGGGALVTERPGQMRLVSAGGELSEPLAGVPAVEARNQGGLLDVVLSPDFANGQTIFWSYAEPRDGGSGTSVARGVLVADENRVDEVEVIFRALPTHESTRHYGSRLAFGPDGMLYITTGDRLLTELRQLAQQLDNHNGKTLRIAPDGSVPRDNPFVNETGAQPEIWSLGHRNVQAAAFDEAGRYWIVEHGPQGGDELNLIEKGENYGWPLVSFGEEYSGDPIETAETHREGYEPPVYYWDPVIAPSGAEWYSGDAFPEWRGSLLIGALRETRLVRLEIEDGRVTGEEHLLADRGQRIRDVTEADDGSIYLVTDEEAGEVWRIVPN